MAKEDPIDLRQRGSVGGSMAPVVAAPARKITTGQVVVPTAGTAVPLSPGFAIMAGVKIKALAANTGDIYVGDSAVYAAEGFVLDAGESEFFEIDNPGKIWIDASVNGDGVSYFAS